MKLTEKQAIAIAQAFMASKMNV
jgi:hypothetical protein